LKSKYDASEWEPLEWEPLPRPTVKRISNDKFGKKSNEFQGLQSEKHHDINDILYRSMMSVHDKTRKLQKIDFS